MTEIIHGNLVSSMKAIHVQQLTLLTKKKVLLFNIERISIQKEISNGLQDSVLLTINISLQRYS